MAFHNQFFDQIRSAFVIDSYYPAITGACALGERILNHLMITLRDDFKDNEEYKKVYDKNSFDDWGFAISTLENWEVLLPDVAKRFRELQDKRHKAIHFRPEVDHNVRELALEAINCITSIIGTQFSGFGAQPWFITNLPGEPYIKKEWEANPFIKKIYLPNCMLVGPYHVVEQISPWVIKDEYIYAEKDITDEEFVDFRNKFKG